MKPLACSGPGELLHVDFTSIEETVPLKEDPVIRNVLVLQDHFSKYVVTYVVKDQTACTAAETLRIGYFGLFGAPAYLVSDQGKAFTGHVITHLCESYGVQKLRTSPYQSQLEDWPVYKVKCPTSDARQKPKYRILHRNRLLLVTNEDAPSIPGQAQAKVTPIVSNATLEAFSEETGLLEKLLPSLVTQQGGDMTSQVWLNGEFHTKPWTQTVPEATQSPLDLMGDEVSEPESEFSDSVPEGM